MKQTKNRMRVRYGEDSSVVLAMDRDFFKFYLTKQTSIFPNSKFQIQ